MDLKTLRNTFIAGLMAANPLNAEEDKPTLRASPEIRSQLSSITDIFLDIADQNVIALSQEDLAPDDPFLQRQMRMAQIMGTSALSLFTMDEALERIGAIKDEHQIGSELEGSELPPSWQEHMQIAADAELFDSIYSNRASARHVPIINQEEDDCLVISPSLSGQAGRVLTMLAYLPAEHYPTLNDAITYEDIYQFIMLHEAAHCAQEHPNDVLSKEENLTALELDISNNLLRLDMETQADEIALEKMRLILEREDRPPELASEIADAVRAVRSIGALRMGADIFEGAEFYPKHATHVFNEQPDFDYDGADVFLAIKLTTTLVNTSMGYLHGNLAQQSVNPNLSGALTNDNDFPVLILAPQEAASAGMVIAHELPEIQYGTIRAILELSEKFPEMDSLSGEEYDYLRTSLNISRQIMRNHIDAVQEYYPTIANSVLAKDSYDHLMELGEAAVITAENYEYEPSEEAPTPPRDYSSLSPHLQNMMERFEESLTTPTNAMETLVLVRHVVAFFEDFEMMLELEFEREMQELERPALPPRKTQPFAPPAPRPME